jgi:integrase
MKTTATVTHNLIDYSLKLEPTGWRMRRTSKDGYNANYRTGTTDLRVAKLRCLDWLQNNQATAAGTIDPHGTCETLVGLYAAALKKANGNTTKLNIKRFRMICRVVFGKELKDVQTKDITPTFWEAYQRAVFAKHGIPFELCNRHRFSIGLNGVMRCARSMFQSQFADIYRKAGLAIAANAAQFVQLPEPILAPRRMDDTELVAAWRELKQTNFAMYLAIGLGRFAGMRLNEVANCRFKWIDCSDPSDIGVDLQDWMEPENPKVHQYKSKTGAVYRAMVSDPEFAADLMNLAQDRSPEAFVIPTEELRKFNPVLTQAARNRWFERQPQAWCHEHGITELKPFHKLRALYVDQLVKQQRHLFMAREAGLRFAQSQVGHAHSSITETHYASPELGLANKSGRSRA